MSTKKAPSQPGAARGRKLADPNETSDAKFKRLTEARVLRALTSIRLLKNLSRFKPSETHRQVVFSALEEALETAEMSWRNEPKSAAKFVLPEPKPVAEVKQSDVK